MNDGVIMVTLDTIASLAKRRGFVFPGSEIYGGFGGFWDYGPLGTELKRNVKEAWWRAMVHHRDDIVGLDSAIVMSPRVWEASGHLVNFTDPLVDCLECKRRFRADDLEGERCPVCSGELTPARQFNMMFKTFVGPVAEDAAVAYLRPETAQGIFVNFKNVQASTRKKLPFGIAQIGKSFRNEITPGRFTFRSREFEQMEMEFFTHPNPDVDWHAYWVEERYQWFVRLGVTPSRLRLYDHPKEKLSHYSRATTDIEYEFPWGWGELEGIADRTDFDLKAHSEASGEDLSYFDDESGQRVTPWVIEPAAGVDRTVLVFLLDAYHEEPDKEGTRIILRFHPDIAPIKVAVLPLSRKEPLVARAREVWAFLRSHFASSYDDAQSIGRRYRRQDEVGTPFCVTVDFDSLNDNQVTIRHRDTMEQVRVPITDLVGTLATGLATWSR
jgi:glycyl-tRNA synthetase